MGGLKGDPGWVLDWEPTNLDLSEYMEVLGHVIVLVSQQVETALGLKTEPEGKKTLPISVGEWVYVKIPGRPHWSEVKWGGPYKVIQVSNSSVKIDRNGDDNWHHFAHCSKTKKAEAGVPDNCMDTDPS